MVERPFLLLRDRLKPAAAPHKIAFAAAPAGGATPGEGGEAGG